MIFNPRVCRIPGALFSVTAPGLPGEGRVNGGLTGGAGMVLLNLPGIAA
jgi:hypothetical protein